MIFQTEVKENQYGAGLFACETIPKGSVWWQQTETNTLRISRGQYQSLVNSQIDQTKNPLAYGLFESISCYSYYSKKDDSLLLVFDNSRFVNHSDSPNSKCKDGKAHALRDILAGEEIREDYTLYDQYPWPERWDDFSEQEHVSSELRKEYVKEHTEDPIDHGYDLGFGPIFPERPYRITTYSVRRNNSNNDQSLNSLSSSPSSSSSPSPSSSSTSSSCCCSPTAETPSSQFFSNDDRSSSLSSTDNNRSNDVNEFTSSSPSREPSPINHTKIDNSLVLAGNDTIRKGTIVWARTSTNVLEIPKASWSIFLRSEFTLSSLSKGLFLRPSQTLVGMMREPIPSFFVWMTCTS